MPIHAASAHRRGGGGGHREERRCCVWCKRGDVNDRKRHAKAVCRESFTIGAVSTDPGATCRRRRRLPEAKARQEWVAQRLLQRAPCRGVRAQKPAQQVQALGVGLKRCGIGGLRKWKCRIWRQLRCGNGLKQGHCVTSACTKRNRAKQHDVEAHANSPHVCSEGAEAAVIIAAAALCASGGNGVRLLNWADAAAAGLWREEEESAGRVPNAPIPSTLPSTATACT